MTDSTLRRLAAHFRTKRIGNTAVIYLCVAWLVIQVSDTIFPALHFPAWAVSAVVVAAIAGFPLAIAVAWVLDVRARRTSGAPPRPAWTASMIAVVAAVVIVAGLGIGLRFDSGIGDRDDGHFLARRVLVLPLEDRTGDPTLAQVGNMAADWVARGAAHIDGLEVVDPATSLRIASDTTITDDSSRLGTLARDTRAAIVIAGAVYLQQDSVLFQVRITSGSTGEVLRVLPPIHAPRSNPASALDDLRERAMGGLATILDADLPAGGTLASHVPRYSAYQEYLRGLEVAGTHLVEARPHFEAAFALDTAFVLAQLWVARSHLADLWSWHAADSVARLVERRRAELGRLDQHILDYVQATVRRDHAARLRAARAASALAPASRWQNIAVGIALDLNRVGDAFAELERMTPVDRKPADAARYWNTRAAALHRLGRLDEALASAERAVQLAPDLPHVQRQQTAALAALGREEELLRILEQLSTSPDVGPAIGANAGTLAWELQAHGFPAEAHRLYERILSWLDGADDMPPDLRFPARIEALWALGRNAEAAAAAREWAECDCRDEDRHAHYVRGMAAARSGDVVAAEREIQWLENNWREHTAATASVGYSLARIAAALERPERAVAYLRRAYADGLPVTDVVHADPHFARLRGYAAFAELIRPK